MDKFMCSVNWRDIQRKYEAHNVERVKFKGTLTEWPVQKKHLEHHETCKTTRYKIYKINSLYNYVLLFITIFKMLSQRIVEFPF